MLLAPGLPLLAHRTRARHQRDQPHALLQAHPQRALTVGLTIGHNAVHPVEPERDTLLDRHGGFCAVTGVTITQAHTEREALTAYAETQEHLLEIIMSIFAVPIRRTRWDWPLTPVGLLFIGPIEGDRRRILVQPGGREGIDIEGIERDRTKHSVQMRSKQRLEALPQPVIMERGARQVRLEQG